MVKSTESNDRLPRSVWILSWVSFFADVSSEMVYPLLPLFLVGAVGASKTQLGVMEGAAVLLVALLSAYAGMRSDRMQARERRTVWIRWGYGLPVLGKSILALTTLWPLVLGGRLLDRFGKGLRGAPRDALISEAVSDRMRGSAFGLHRAFDTAGALIGVLLSAFLLWWLTDLPQPLQAGEALSPAQEIPAWVFQSIFGVAAFLGLASWLLTFMVTEPNPPSLEANEKSPTQNRPLMNTARASETIAEKRWLDLPKTYWSTLAILVLFSLANSSDSFLLLRTRDLGYSPVAVVLIYALYNITYSAFSYPFGALSDRFGRWRMIAAGWLIYSLVYLCLALLPATQAWAAWPLMALYGAYMALTDGVGKALLADHAPEKSRGAAMGLFYAITGLTTLLASLLAGIAWDAYGPSVALLIGAGFALAALLVLYAVRCCR